MQALNPSNRTILNRVPQPVTHSHLTHMKPTSQGNGQLETCSLRNTPSKRIKRIVSTGICGGFHGVGGELSDRNREGRLHLAGSDMQNSHFSGRFTCTCLNFDSDYVKCLPWIIQQLIFHRGFVCKMIPCTLHPSSHFLTQCLF